MNVGGHETGDEGSPSRLESSRNERDREAEHTADMPLRQKRKLDRSAVELSQVLADGHQALWGAFVLGHRVHQIRAWQYLAHDMPGGEGVWDSVDLALEEIDRAIDAVAGRLSSGQIAQFVRLAAELRKINQASEVTSPPVVFRQQFGKPRHGSVAGQETWERLDVLADGMIGAADGLRLHYEFGRAMAVCHVELNREPAPSDIDLRPVIFAARELTHIGIIDISMIVQVGEIDVVEKTGLEIKRQFVNATVCPERQVGLVAVDLFQGLVGLFDTTELALRTGQGVASHLQHDPKKQERDRWIYEQVQAGGGEIKYTSILKSLERSALTNGWEPIASTNGLKRAAGAYAQRMGLAAPIRRKQGRPKKSK